MKLRLLLLFFLFNNLLIAQSWCPPNAVWHYSIGGGFLHGFDKIEYTSDSLIGGMNCQRLERTRYLFGMQPNGSINLVSSNTLDHFTYLSNDTVYRLSENQQFYPMYIWDAQIGDTWDIEIDANHPFLCDSISTVEVMDTSSIIINGFHLRKLRLATHTGSGWGFDSWVTERIGATGAAHLFPSYRNCDSNTVVEFYLFDFNCYQDDNFSLYPSGTDCEYWLNVAHIQTAHSEGNRVYLDDHNNLRIHLNEHEGARMALISSTGQIVLQQELTESSNHIDLPHLEVGFYFVLLHDGKQFISRQKIQIN